MRKLALLAILAIVPSGLSAARLILRDGSVVEGRFLSGSTDHIVFQDSQGVRRTFNTTQIQTLDFEDRVSPAVSPSYSNDRQENLSRGGADRINDINPNRGRAWTTLQAGTQISVRTDETIDAETSTEGRTYPASIQADVMDTAGILVIPRGSRANLVVRRINEGGTVTSGNLMLDLDSIEVGGRRYDVSTEDIRKGSDTGIGANRRTGEMVGGGAVLGTLLGAIAGGGKGAAIGAIAGAAAGGGVQVLTKGKRIRVPAEAVLNFRLDQPLTLREAR
jgi:hypothetical protein